jgi:hypothetical protein
MEVRVDQVRSMVRIDLRERSVQSAFQGVGLRESNNACPT